MPKTFFVSRRKKIFSALAVLFLSITQALAQPAYAAGYGSWEYPSVQSSRNYFDWSNYWDKLMNLFAPSPTATPTPTPQPPTKDFYRVNGTQIVNSSGTPVQLKGIGMGNNVWYTQNQLPTTDHDEESFSELEQLGFNSVRFYLNASLFESDNTPYIYSEAAFQWLDDNVQWAKKHNIRLLLNMHIPQGGKIKVTNAVFWDDSEYQKRFIALWTEIARRYAEEDAVLGYGLLNEPYLPECSSPKESLDIYYNLLEDTIASIRAVDTNHILFIERPLGVINPLTQKTSYVWGATDCYRILPDTNTVYEFHFYDKTEFTHQGLTWVPYSDKWIYGNDTIALLSGARQAVHIQKTTPCSIDYTSTDWQQIESNPITITDTSVNYGYWTLYLNTPGQNATLYIDNIIVKEYDENGVFLRDLRNLDFNTSTLCIGSDLGSGAGGVLEYASANGINSSGGLLFHDIGNSYRFYRENTTVRNFPLIPRHSYVISADIRFENISENFSVELGLQTATCNHVYSFDKEYLYSALQPYLDFSKQNNIAVYLGEFGVATHLMNDTYHGDSWIKDVFDILSENDISFSYHDYHEESFGLYMNDSRKPRNNKNQILYNIFVDKLN